MASIRQREGKWQARVRRKGFPDDRQRYRRIGPHHDKAQPLRRRRGQLRRPGRLLRRHDRRCIGPGTRRCLDVHHGNDEPVAAMLGALSKLGADATGAEMIGATTGLEALAAISGIMAAGYTSAVIGSVIVAANDSMACTSTALVPLTVTRWASANGLHLHATMMAFLQRNPEVIKDLPRRSSYALRHRATTSNKRAALA
jgi:hypothetical protein